MPGYYKSLFSFPPSRAGVALTLLLATAAFVAPVRGSAQTLNVLYGFTGGTDGGQPHGSLIQASDGNLYGMTKLGGLTSGFASYGTVFQITTSGTLGWTYDFTGGSDGANPEGSLIQASDGNLYGVTAAGGAHGYGTAFQITTSGTLGWTYSFAGGSSDGTAPWGSLIEANDGYLYGTTRGGGVNYWGTVFKITTAGTETVLYSFTGGSDGAVPIGSLVQASDGNLYGTTLYGGVHPGINGYGTVFQISTSGTLGWTYDFTDSNDGRNAVGSLVQASDGNLYGMTNRDGANGYGTVFQITTSGTLGWTYGFTGGSDGSSPIGSLIQASDGNLYGMTENGGIGGGDVFQITTLGTLTPVYSFTGKNDGANPIGSLLQASDGNLYGMTGSSGANYWGAVFQIPLSIPLTLTFANPMVTAGSNITGTVSIPSPAPVGGTNIALSLPSGSFDFADSPFSPYGQTVTIPAGTTSATFQIETSHRIVRSESTTVTASGNGGSESATITNILPLITAISFAQSSVTAGSDNQGTISLGTGASSAGLEIILGSSTPGITISPSSVLIGPGQTTSPSFTISSNAGSFASPTTVTVIAGVFDEGRTTATYTINPSPATSLTVTGVSGTPGQKVGLPATLATVGGVPLAGVKLSYQVGSGSAFTATTNSSGVASPNYIIPNNPGTSLPITVSYNGSTLYTSSSGSGTLTIQQLPTTIAVAPVSGTPGQMVTLPATLTSGGVPLAGVKLSYQIGSGSAFTATTNSAGVASPNYTIPNGSGSSLPITVSYNGSTVYASSTGSGTLAVQLASTAVTVPSVSGVPGQVVQLPATLTDSLGNPVAGVKLSYQIGSGSAFTATTNSVGVASPSYTIPNSPNGSLPITVSFNGSLVYAGSAGSGTLTIGQVPTTITVPSVGGAPGQAIALSATLTSNGKPLSGVKLLFTIGSGTPFVGTTNASGVASPGYVLPWTPGVLTVTVTYAGTSTYSGSSAMGNIFIGF